jgi:hypothetical protein
MMGDNIKINLRKTGCGCVNWIQLAQVRFVAACYVPTVVGLKSLYLQQYGLLCSLLL